MRFNAERRQQIIELRNQGMSRIQIASHLGISKDSVGAYLYSLLKDGIIEPIAKEESKRRRTSRPSVTQKVNAPEARQMRQDGKSYLEIAEHYDVSVPTITKVIGRSTRITPLQQQLIELHLQGMTYDEIANHVGKPEGTVAVILSRLVKKGLVPARPRTASDKVDVKEARQLRLDGNTFQEIAKRFGVSAPTIVKLIGHKAKGKKKAKKGGGEP